MFDTPSLQEYKLRMTKISKQTNTPALQEYKLWTTKSPNKILLARKSINCEQDKIKRRNHIMLCWTMLRLDIIEKLQIYNS